MLGKQNKIRCGKVALIALLAVTLFAGEAILMTFWSDQAFAGSGNNGGGKGGGGGGGGGGKGGGGGGGSGGGGSNGGSNNGGGNGPGSNSAGGNGKGKGHKSAADDTESTDVEANSALTLREMGLIRPLEDVYKAAEKQFGGEVLDAKLVGSPEAGWSYDLRVVTEDGHVHNARYDATTLALRALDDQLVE